MHKAKLITTVLTIVCLPVMVLAQPLQLDWVVEYPCFSPNALEYDKVKTDEAQNVYLFGSASSDISPFFNGNTILTQKYDSTGSLLWESKFDYKDGHKFYDCAFDGDGGLLVGGSKVCFLGSQPCRAVLLSYDAETGEENWHTFIFDTIQQGANLKDLDLDSDGHVYAVGTVNFHLAEYDSNKLFLAKIIRETGSTVWTFVSQNEFSAFKVKVLEDRVRVFGFKRLEGPPGYAYILKDIDLSGNPIDSVNLPVITEYSGIYESYFSFDKDGYLIGFSDKVYKFSVSTDPVVWSFDFARGLPNLIGKVLAAITDENGSVYATGYLKDTITQEESTQTIKLTPDGDLIWATVDKFPDTTDFERGWEIAASQHHVFVGSVIGYSTPNGPAAQRLDYRPILYSQTDGSILYDSLIDVDYHDYLDYAHYGQGHFYLLGRSYYPSSSNPDDYRYQLFKFGVEEPSSVSGQPERQALVDIFPNPASGSLTISQLGKQHFDQAVLYDAQGRLVYSHLLSSQEQRLQLPGLVAGVYSLELRGSNAAITRKIVVQP